MRGLRPGGKPRNSVEKVDAEDKGRDWFGLGNPRGKLEMEDCYTKHVGRWEDDSSFIYRMAN